MAGAVVAGAALVIGGFAAWGGQLFGPGGNTAVSSALTKFDLQVSDGDANFVDGTREEPLILTSPGTSQDLIRNGMEWTVIVRNEGAASDALYFVICDPSSSKVKYRIAPGKDEIYPDLFTQLTFTVTDSDGAVVIDHATLGADANNDPLGDGTIRGDIAKVIQAGGGEAEFTVRAQFSYDPDDSTRTKLAAYTGVSTDFGIRIEGESY